MSDIVTMLYVYFGDTCVYHAFLTCSNTVTPLTPKRCPANEISVQLERVHFGRMMRKHTFNI